MKTAIIRDDASFSQAFAQSRKAKADEFCWRGQNFHTKTRQELGLPEPTPTIERSSVIIGVIERPN